MGSKTRMNSEIFGVSRYSKLNQSGSGSNLHENSIAFKIGGDNIPEASAIRDHGTRRERMDSLTKIPRHKPSISKFDGTNRTLAPLTYEDLGQFDNIALISTLREAVTTKNPGQ